MFIVNKSVSMILSMSNNGLQVIGQKVGSKFYNGFSEPSHYFYHNIRYNFNGMVSDIESKVYKKGKNKIFGDNSLKNWKYTIHNECGVKSCSLPESSMSHGFPILYIRGDQIDKMYTTITRNINNYYHILDYMDGLNGANDDKDNCWVELGMANREQYKKCVELLNYMFDKNNYLEFIDESMQDSWRDIFIRDGLYAVLRRW